MDLMPTLPVRFPCWVQAVYSWGGENKKDLGFVEGDLIECLNAGDGSWWMGRLRRDRRAIGLFPSNFVKLLPESFVPQSPRASPIPEPKSDASPRKSKGTFKRPYQSYGTPLKQSPSRSLETSPLPSRQNSNQQSQHTPSRQNSYQQAHETPSRNNSYLHAQHTPSRQSSNQSSNQSRGSVSARPVQYGYASRQGSRGGSPYSAQHMHSRSPSPSPLRYHETSRGPSPGPDDALDSSPPPPPPHRVPYTQPATRAHTPAPQSPASRTPGHHEYTPSPLRDAIDDVITSLEDMTTSPRHQEPESGHGHGAASPWSPDNFHTRTSKPRPQTSLGLGVYDLEDHGRNPHQVYTEDVMVPNEHESNHHRMKERLRSMRSDLDHLDGRHMGRQPMSDAAFSAPEAPNHGVTSQRPLSSMETHYIDTAPTPKLRNRKSAYELGRQAMARTMTLKSSFTNVSSGTSSTATHGSTSTHATSKSLMSGYSAGGFSATSAGSLARRKVLGSMRRKRPQSVGGVRADEIFNRNMDENHPPSEATGISYHSSHATDYQEAPNSEWGGSVVDSGAPLGGLAKLKPKRSGFLKKLVDSAKAGAASTRSSISGGGQEVSRNPVRGTLSSGIQGISSSSVAQDMGLGPASGGANSIQNSDWVRIRRDINRSNTLSKIERHERRERCEMLGQPDIQSVDIFLDEIQGDEGADGRIVSEPTAFHLTNLQMVDKSARFINSLPPMTNPTSLAQGYVCRPYRSDIQRLRAIFTWVSEKISWEEDYEGDVDTRRAIQSRRGTTREIAVLVMEMCQAVGLACEVVQGFLKSPNELPSLESMPRANHYWNFVVCDGEWRMIDCALASPTNPRRSLYSNTHSSAAESFYFLARPMEACYTHIPMEDNFQHLLPTIDPAVLLALPCALPPYFRNNLQLHNYSTSLLYLEGLELMQISIAAPSDTEVFAEVTARTLARDADGDLFESGESTTKRALSQAEWKNGTKIFHVKAVLPGDEGNGVLRVYAGKRGLMHSIKDNPHSLALCLPIFHTGENPPFDFFVRHPTPHAQRHDLYLAQPQCHHLVCNNTFVFNVRQHPSSMGTNGGLSPTLGGGSSVSGSSVNRAPSPAPGMGIARPPSSMSMTSSQASGSNPSSSNYSDPSKGGKEALQKPAKLAIQAPSGKILRLSKKVEGGFVDLGGTWETIIKVGERGIWRGLVLADRSARWCVWGEWECV